MHKYLQFGKSVLKKRLDLQSRILVKNSSWVFIASLINQILVLLRSVVIARGLGVEIYGVYVIAVAFVNNIQEILNLNLGTPLTRFGAFYKTEGRSDKLTVLIKGCFLVATVSAFLSIAAISILLVFFYDVFLTKPGLFGFVILYAIAGSFNFFDFLSSSLLRLYSRFKLNSIITIIMSLLETAIITVAIYLFPKNLNAFFLAVVSGLMISSAICNFTAYWELRREFLPHVKLKFTTLKDQWREIRKFTINNSISRTVQTLTARGDVLLLGAIAGPVQVGLYNIGKRLTSALGLIISPLSQAIYPQLSILVAKRSFEDIKQMLRKITVLAAFPSLIFLVIMFFFKKNVILFLYGNEYAAAAEPFFILLINAVIASILFWSLYLVVSLGMVGFRLIANLIALAIGIIVAVALISKGAIGVAYGFLASTMTIQTLFILFSFRRIHSETLKDQ